MISDSLYGKIISFIIQDVTFVNDDDLHDIIMHNLDSGIDDLISDTDSNSILNIYNLIVCNCSPMNSFNQIPMTGSLWYLVNS